MSGISPVRVGTGEVGEQRLHDADVDALVPIAVQPSFRASEAVILDERAHRFANPRVENLHEAVVRLAGP